MAVVFDPHEEHISVWMNFQNTKHNREETPEDIKLAFPYIVRIIEANEYSCLSDQQIRGR
jgi:hypothetical protein